MRERILPVRSFMQTFHPFWSGKKAVLFHRNAHLLQITFQLFFPRGSH